MKEKVYILYIVTGRYTVYWDEFYSSMKEHFLPECERHVVLFTDDPAQFPQLPDDVQLQRIARERWPFQTLMRYRTFLEHQALWKDADYVFYINADYFFFRDIHRDILPTAEEGCLVVAEHRKSLELQPEEYPYERDERSTAYISVGQGSHYLAGGFNGGRREDFLRMSQTIHENTMKDLFNGIIAVWHDESHLNRYLCDRKFKVLPPTYVWPEYAMNRKNRHLVFAGPRDKMRYGGHAWLRGATDKKMPSKFRRRLPRYVAIAMLSLLLLALFVWLACR